MRSVRMSGSHTYTRPQLYHIMIEIHSSEKGRAMFMWKKLDFKKKAWSRKANYLYILCIHTCSVSLSLFVLESGIHMI